MARHNSKIQYYLKNILRLAVPDGYYRSRLNSKIHQLDRDDFEAIRDRVNYYLKRSAPFSLGNEAVDFKAFCRTEKKTYHFDLRRFYQHFPAHYKLTYIFGDVIEVPACPTIVKSRPVAGNNENSVLMKLNEVRHFYFVRDRLPFQAKVDRVVWRGGAYKEPRRTFVRACHGLRCCDVGQTNRPPESVPWQKPKLSISEQLKYKFIVSVEGNDVATNLKWIMSSNSLCFMRRPRYETWFMEGRLRAGVHYVELADDFSDLAEKCDYYSTHTDEALAILENAHRYVNQFLNSRREELIALLVLKRYFELSGQAVADP